MASSIARPRFLGRLQAHDFKVVAATGCFVYVYLRSTDGSPYYVGITKDQRRPLGKSHSCIMPKDRTLVRVLRAGLTWAQACEWERRYIARWGRKNNGTGILRNLTDGGEGAPGLVITAEHRAKIASSQKGRVHTAEHRAKNGAMQRGKTITPEHRAKISASNRGRTVSSEQRAKMSAAMKGRIITPEWRANISAAAKNRTYTPEVRAKMSAARKGRTLTAEHRANISAGLQGRTHTPETRAKISAASKRAMTPERRAQISATLKRKHAEKPAERISGRFRSAAVGLGKDDRYHNDSNDPGCHLGWGRSRSGTSGLSGFS